MRDCYRVGSDRMQMENVVSSGILAFSEKPVPAIAGTTAAGLAEQLCGVLVLPAVQLRFTLLLYPLIAEIMPL